MKQVSMQVMNLALLQGWEVGSREIIQQQRHGNGTGGCLVGFRYKLSDSRTADE